MNSCLETTVNSLTEKTLSLLQNSKDLSFLHYTGPLVLPMHQATNFQSPSSQRQLQMQHSLYRVDQQMQPPASSQASMESLVDQVSYMIIISKLA